jgi:hypothetical protein
VIHQNRWGRSARLLNTAPLPSVSYFHSLLPLSH